MLIKKKKKEKNEEIKRMHFLWLKLKRNQTKPINLNLRNEFKFLSYFKKFFRKIKIL